MKIFLSHSSKNKPLVREVKRHLPEHIKSWLDEKDILIGDDLGSSIRNGIESSSDFVVIFIDSASVKSSWVKKELSWSLEKESELNRTFILPILLDNESWQMVEPKEFCNRKYLSCLDFSESSIRQLANNLIAELFALLSREVDFKKNFASQKLNPALQLLDEADSFIAKIADEIREVVFPYRKLNPLDIFELFKQLDNNEIIGSLNQKQFNQLLLRLKNQGFLSGLVFNGRHIYIDEEHYSWKTEMFVEGKKKIANKGISFIKSNNVVALDAGSTTLELAKHISQGLKMRIWKNLKIVTNSIPAANELLTTSSEMGFDDENTDLTLFITGGRIRPNTLAVVTTDQDVSNTQFSYILNKLGGADVCFVGTNGISKDYSFTTHNNIEVLNKKDILRLSKKKVILSDSSKFGIIESEQFATFDEEITVITNKGDKIEILNEYQEFLKKHKTSIIVV